MQVFSYLSVAIDQISYDLCSQNHGKNPLSKMWGKDAIKQWVESLDAQSPDFEPSDDVSKALPGIRLP